MLAQGVATICTTHGHHNPSALPINLSTEAGSIGGVPTGGLRFGASHNAAAHMPCATMIDFYNGGGVDVACLGMAEVSASCCRCYSACLLGIVQGNESASCQECESNLLLHLLLLLLLLPAVNVSRKSSRVAHHTSVSKSSLTGGILPCSYWN